MSQTLVAVSIRLSVNKKYIVDPSFQFTPDTPSPTPGENPAPPTPALPSGTYVFDSLQLALDFVKTGFEGMAPSPL